jgi:hypothetical protein
VFYRTCSSGLSSPRRVSYCVKNCTPRSSMNARWCDISCASDTQADCTTRPAEPGEVQCQALNSDSPSLLDISLVSSFTTLACEGPSLRAFFSFSRADCSPWASPWTLFVNQRLLRRPYVGAITLPSSVFLTQPVMPYSVAFFCVKSLVH